ncbi:MAG: ATP-grasp domain-containing protein [Oscillospiraceae bacterium]|nr:ATP-grasp domain-containing protein [Oscillospiraceae bacterium]
MIEKKILFTGIGRRIELVQAFRQAALALNINLKIYGADMAGTAPALAFCDAIRRVCGMKEKDYILQLLDICDKDNIDLLIPTIDTDLLVLSLHHKEFEKIGTKVLVSKPDRIAICRDKNFTADYFEGCGLKAPHTYNDYTKYSEGFPCFIKPKDGSSSINAFKVNSTEELAVYAQKIGDYIIQPFIEGTEYTIDIFCDFNGNPITVIPRERTQVRAGEVLKTRITMDPIMIQEGIKLIECFKPCGPMAVQLIRQKGTDLDYFIEINPRFGGGSPLSMKAGADSAEAVLRLLLGETVLYHKDDINDQAVYSRFDQCVCINRGTDQRPIKGVIFDLDDTLYDEKEYVRSGFHSIANYLEDAESEDSLWKLFKAGKPALDEYLQEIGRKSEKDVCLKIYREHMPDLVLHKEVEELMTELKKKGVRVGIITDGRVEGQRNKIAVLGLADLVDDIIITDALGGIQFRKPNDISFRIMQNRWRIPFEQMAYVGDNPVKDSLAPQQLGMKFIWFRNKNGLYYDCHAATQSCVINEITDVSKIIRSE